MNKNIAPSVQRNLTDTDKHTQKIPIHTHVYNFGIVTIIKRNFFLLWSLKILIASGNIQQALFFHSNAVMWHEFHSAFVQKFESQSTFK